MACFAVLVGRDGPALAEQIASQQFAALFDKLAIVLPAHQPPAHELPCLKKDPSLESSSCDTRKLIWSRRMLVGRVAMLADIGLHSQ
jgi:hypothetical protein